jgi:hypothetical protein
LALLLLLSAFVWLRQGLLAQEIQHPVDSLRRVRPPKVWSATLHSEGEPRAGSASNASRLAPIAEIGGTSGPLHRAFGQLTDAAIWKQLGGNRVLVLDGRSNRVHIYADSFRHLGSFGESGPGPAKWISPRALVGAPNAPTAYVGDYDGSIEVFDVSDPRNVRHIRTIAMKLQLYDMCMIGANLFVLGYSQNASGPIHRLNLETGDVSSFGNVYNSRNPLLKLTLTEGHLACSEAGTVAYAPYAVLNEIWGFTPAGDVQWMVSLDGSRSPIVTEDKQGAVTVRFPTGGFHRIRSLTEFGGSVFVQVAEEFYEQPDAESSLVRGIHSFRISPAGAQRLQVSVPGFIRAIAGNRLVSIAQSGDWRLHLFRNPFCATCGMEY